MKQSIIILFLLIAAACAKDNVQPTYEHIFFKDIVSKTWYATEVKIGDTVYLPTCSSATGLDYVESFELKDDYTFEIYEVCYGGLVLSGSWEFIEVEASHTILQPYDNNRAKLFKFDIRISDNGEVLDLYLLDGDKQDELIRYYKLELSHN